MKNGGGGQYDMVSSSGDADLRIIYAGDARPVNMSLIPSVKDFFPAFQSPAFNTVDGKHYGVSLQWGPNVLMYNKKDFPTAPTSWNVLYSSKYQGQITVPDNPIQIADAALYLKAHQPSLKITDPYELTQAQFQASVKLLATQRPLIKKYWALASQEISEFKNGDARLGAGWPYQVSALKGTNFPIGSVVPSEGATGWADTWMLAAKAPHPNCAYDWLRYISEPKVQAEQAVNYGETPDNKLACPFMNKLQKGSCALYHANAPQSYFNTISLWKTPVATCDNGQQDCVPYSGVAAGLDHPGHAVAVAAGQAAAPAKTGRGRAVAARLLGAVAPPVGAGHIAAHPGAGLVRADLPRGAGRAADHGVLADQRVHHQHRARLERQ